MGEMMFSGSYCEEDVIFLLKKIDMPTTSVEEKERAIQSGGEHYSEMISVESAPSEEYQKIFKKAVDRNGNKFANHIIILANKIIEESKNKKEITIVSLARAGTPIGILVKRAIEKIIDKAVLHFSVSIIRDRGIDKNAIRHILLNHSPETLFFVDGWTGKGVIGKELVKSIGELNKELNINISPNLYVVADISGTAFFSSTNEDYLLPSAVLNSTVSGLISRTILNKKYISENDFHGCVFLNHLKDFDLSNWFIEKIVEKMDFSTSSLKDDFCLRENNIIFDLMSEMGITNINFIKPGVGEATRVLLRRIPKKLFLRDLLLPEVEHLVFLAKSKGVDIEIRKDLSYNAVSIIEQLD